MGFIKERLLLYNRNMEQSAVVCAPIAVPIRDVACCDG